MMALPDNSTRASHTLYSSICLSCLTSRDSCLAGFEASAVATDGRSITLMRIKRRSECSREEKMKLKIMW